jgi:hypothetical protein
MVNKRPDQGVEPVMIVIVLLALTYNAILAVINAWVMPLGFNQVAVVEFSILIAALVYIMLRGLYREDILPLAYLGFTIFIALYMSVVNQGLVIEYFRNILIIFIFFIAGTRAEEKTVRILFLLAASLVLAVLTLEIISTAVYGDVFYPLSYFENTRGLKQVSFGGSKLFQNSLHFEGRFSFGIIDHRANSLFLEQVSLSNFSGILMLFTSSFWQRLRNVHRCFFVSLIVLILLTTDSRTMLIYSAVTIFGYFVFPKIPSKFSLLFMPGALFMGLVMYVQEPDASGDNFTGRIVLTMKHIFDIDLMAMLGLRAADAAAMADSGYPYIIYAGTIFGFIALWLFVSLYPAGETPAQRRCTHGLSIFMFLNFMIGATPLFSIKIAALMWYFVGYMKYSEDKSMSWRDDPYSAPTIPAQSTKTPDLSMRRNA